MMAQKAKLFNDLEIYEKVIHCNTPKEAKGLGRQVSGFNESIWKKYRYEIVRIGNIHKFNQNPSFGAYLLNTQSKVLVESSPVDIIWGIGLTKDSVKVYNVYEWRGLSLLGFALMEVRDLLREYGIGASKLSEITLNLPEELG